MRLLRKPKLSSGSGGVRQRSGPQAKSPVFSYYANRPGPELTSTNKKSSGTAAGGKLSFWQLLPSMLALLAILVSVGYVLTLDMNPRLSRSTLEANSLLQADEVYEDALARLLKGSIFNRSKLLINAPSLERKLREQYPELASATITIPLTSRRPILAIEPVVPTLILKTSHGDFLLDYDGKAVLKAENVRAEMLAKLPAVKDDSGLQVDIGQTALPKGQAQFVREIAHQFKAKDIAIENMTLPTIANELHVHLTGEGHYIKFNMQGDARLGVGTYFALRDRLAAEGKKPSEYVDVRIEEKVFYK